MVKISIGNLSQDATTDELLSLFSQYGKVAGCTIVKNSGFVYMDNKVEAEEAIRSLHQHELHGQPMTVELSRGKSKGSAKLHIGNISCTNQELRAKFEEFGTVLECDIVKNNATLHMERLEDAMEAIDKMHNSTFKGKLMTIQLSTSRPRTPGHTGCYLCGKHGHFSKDCPFSLNGSRSGWAPPCGPPSYGRGSYGRTSPSVSSHMGGRPLSRATHGGGLLPTPRRPSGYSSELGDQYWSGELGHYPERSSVYDCHHLNSGADYYAQPYGSSRLEDSRISSPLLPLPSSAANFARHRSQIRRVPPADYAKRSRPPLSPSRSSYATSRPRDNYMSRYSPY